MGLTELKIGFIEEKRRAIEGASTGVVLLLLKETTLTGLKEYTSFDEVKENYTETNKKYIEQAFMGNVQDVRNGTLLEQRAYTPTKVMVYALEEAGLDTVLEELENEEFNYMCMPEATDEGGENAKLIEFINNIGSIGYDASLVCATKTPPNSSNVINFELDEIKEGDITYTANSLLAHICGICAGTPLTQSITYCHENLLTNIVKKTDEENDEAIDAGKLILIKKAGKIRIARGVTSLATTNENEGESFKKIKLVRTYKLIGNSIKKVITEFYVGKVSNSYDNKVLLISEIGNFLKLLNNDSLIEEYYSIDIDLEATKKYLKEQNIDYSSFTEQEIKESDTGSKVFLSLSLKGIDAMEDFNIKINV